MTGGGNSITETAPPMAHAVGGSLGSALALLLLYPLERARVELQTTQTNSNARTASSSPQDINDKVKPLVERRATSRRGGAAVAVTVSPPAERIEEDKKHSSQSSEESWELQKISSSSSSDKSLLESSKTTQQKTSKNKLGLVACLVQLHQRKQLYRGAAPVVITMAASNFVFFYMHSFLKQLLLPSASVSSHQKIGRGSSTLQLSLLASSLAGIVNVLLTNPMWVANLRIVTSGNNNNNQQQQHPNNLWQEMKHIVETEGWVHLWNGTPASLLLVSNPVIQFVAYEQLKNRLLSIIHRNKGGGISVVRRSSLKPLEAFILGAVAKAISTVLTYPLQLAQTVLRVQKQGLQSVPRKEAEEHDDADTPTTRPLAHTNTTPTYQSTLDCLLKIYRHKGVEGWFAGMRTKLLQTVLTAAFTFLTYEQIIRVIMTVHRALADNRHSHKPLP